MSVAMILVDLRTSLAREDSVFMNTPRYGPDDRTRINYILI